MAAIDNLKDAVSGIVANWPVIGKFVNGSEADTIETDAGTLPVLAKVVGDAQNTFEQAKTDLIAQKGDEINTAADGVLAQVRSVAVAVSTNADAASNAASIAAVSANAAAAQAGVGAAANSIYATTAAGIAGTANGKFFYVPSTSTLGSYDVWLNAAGVPQATGITLPNLSAVQANTKLTNMLLAARGAFAVEDGYTYQQVQSAIAGFTALIVAQNGQALLGQLGDGLAVGQLRVMQSILDSAGRVGTSYGEFNYDWALADPDGNVLMGLLNGVLRGAWEFSRTRSFCPRAAIIGDSINAANGMGVETPGSNRQLGCITAANAMAGWPLDIVANLAVSGTTLQTIAASVTAALSYQPDVVFIDGGTNNIGTTDSPETIAALMGGILDRVLATGATAVFQNIGPYPGSATKIHRINRLYRQLAASRPNAVLIDFFGAGVNPAAAALAWLGGYSYDNTHPTNRGAYYVAKQYERVVRQIAPIPRRLVEYVGEEWNGEANAESGVLNDSALMLNSSNGVATNWNLGPASGAAVNSLNSIEGHPDGFGNVQVMSMTSTLAAGVIGEYRATYAVNMKDRGLVEGTQFWVESWIHVEATAGGWLGAEVFGDAVYNTDTGAAAGQNIIGGEVITLASNVGAVGVPAQNFVWRSPIRTIAVGHAPDASTDYTVFQIRCKFNGPGSAVVKFGQTAFRKIVN